MIKSVLIRLNWTHNDQRMSHLKYHSPNLFSGDIKVDFSSNKWILPGKITTRWFDRVKMGQSQLISFLFNGLNRFWQNGFTIKETWKMDRIVNSEKLFHSSLTRLMKCSILTTLVSRCLIFYILDIIKYLFSVSSYTHALTTSNKLFILNQIEFWIILRMHSNSEPPILR